MRYQRKIDLAVLKWAYQRSYKPSFIIKALVFMGDGPFWLIVMAVAAFIGQIFNALSFEQAANLLIFGLMITNIVITPLKKKSKTKTALCK